MKLKVIELFGGIGACSKALQNIGIEPEIVDYVEIDKYAVASFNAIHNTTFEPQDITTWNKSLECDLIMHGSPCQDFSLAGKQAGGDKDSGTRSSLMYETLRIVEKIKPKYVIWENVKNLVSKKHIHNFEAYLEQMEALGYNNYWKVLNAKNYGIPQNRERVYTVSIRKDINKTFEFPEGEELKIKLKDMLEEDVEEKYYLSDRIASYFIYNEQQQIEKGNGFRFNVTNGDVVAKTITTRAGSRMDDNFIGDKKLYIKNATKLGYLEAYEGDGVDISSRMKYHRGNVQPQSIQTIDCTGGESKGVVLSDLRIRRLTPKECWRLMGFDDEDFDKASQVCSNTQLYKQAGNSIVVNVLMAIFKNLLDD